MKYTIEITDSGKCREHFEYEDEKYGLQEFENTHVITEYGSHSLDKDIVSQLEVCGFNDEILEKYEDAFDGFLPLHFLELYEEFMC